MSLREDALAIARAAIAASDPAANTAARIREAGIEGPVAVFSIGKAAAPMARAAAETLGDRIRTGLLVTKYGHAAGFSSPRFETIEAAHPVSDDNSERAAARALALAAALGEGDTALVLLSGGGSALFEKSAVPAALQRDITQKLLARGAEIEEINAVRKRLSLVKGGRFAAACYPARVITVALSDVLSDDPGTIASGITTPDRTTEAAFRRIWEKYLYDVDAAPPPAGGALTIRDGGFYYAGSVRMLCEAAVRGAEALGYRAELVTASLTGEAREQPRALLSRAAPGEKRAYVCGGETTVTLRGAGLGGRNQEMALAAALALEGKSGVAFLSVGSDGTDGPTDAAGGFADGESCARMRRAGTDPARALENNDSYHALLSAGDLIVTGPTGTNVNDLTVVLTE